MQFLEKVKGLLLSPAATFRAVRDETLGNAFVYFLVLLVVFGVLLAAALAALLVIFAKYFPQPLTAELPVGVSVAVLGGFMFAGMLIYALIVGIIGIFIMGLWLHLWVFAFGGRRGVSQTLKACMYAATPSLLFGWVPFVGIVFALWALALQIIGIRELHEISTGKAVAAVLVSIAVVVAFVVALIFLVLPWVLPPLMYPTCSV
ncbi:YIP1 family protein [Candidatus Alkanophaga liquidiphilum]